jgi:hypothetical protein
MSTNPFAMINNNTGQSNLNSFLIKDKKDQEITTTSNNNNNLFNNLNQQGENNFKNQLSTGANPFNQKNGTNSLFLNNQNNSKNIIQNSNNNNDNNKKEDNPFMKFINKNNNNDSTNINNINIKQNNNNNNISTNINNMNANNNNSFNFFNINNKTDNNNINQKLTQNNIKEEKKESSNIFLAQSNNILKKLNNNVNANKDENNINNIDESKNKIENIAKNDEENQKASEFINNLLAEDKFVYTEKEQINFEKAQLSYKLNEEIVNELKSMLYSQKEKFKKCVENTRLLEERYHQLTKINEKKARDSMDNLIKYEKIISELNLLSENSNSLKQILSIKTDIMGDALEYLKKNNNYNTKNTFAQTVDIDDSSSLYSELKNTSGKLRKIDNDLKVITNTMHKNEKNIIDRSYNIYDKNNINNIIINGQGINDDTAGVWIERENIRDKIYIEQKDMDNLFNDCYNGLNNFRSEQEEFDMKYDLLKSKLIDKINQNNNKNTNLRNNNDNSKYNIINNINNNINNNNINIIPNNIMINNNAFI